MNSYLEESIDLIPDSEETNAFTALYSNDHGNLSLEVRRVLVQLLVGPAIDGERHSKLWQTLVTHEKSIRSRLSELFLELIIDPKTQIAFTRQADAGELEAPTLLKRIKLSLIDSILLLALRQRFIEAEAQGERATISETEIDELLSIYERAINTDQAGFKKRIAAAIENAKERNFIRQIRGSNGRFEISPTLKLLFSAETVIALKNQYQRFLSSNEPFTGEDK